MAPWPAGLLGGCATKAPSYDYAAFLRAKPASLLVMPPLNESPDIKASPSVWAQATRPLAEAGYYVLPVTLVDETFRQNGVSTATTPRRSRIRSCGTSSAPMRRSTFA